MAVLAILLIELQQNVKTNEIMKKILYFFLLIELQQNVKVNDELQNTYQVATFNRTTVECKGI